MKSERHYLWCGICVTLILCGLFFLTGCGVNELENHAFPLALGVEVNGEQKLAIYMAYPDLQDSDASENALSSDVFWKGSGSDLFAGKERMSVNSNKNADFNHLKVLVLQPEILQDTKRAEALIAFFEEEQEAAWNTYVVLTEESMEELFSDDPDISESLGIYLEDLLEEWDSVRDGGLVTVKTLMSQYYNQNETVCVPVLELAEKKPQIKGFELLSALELKGELSLQEGYEMLLLQNKLKQYSFVNEAEHRFSIEQLRTERVVEACINDDGEIYPKLTVNVRGQITTYGSEIGSRKEQEALRQQGKQELADRLQTLLIRQQREHACDVADSFLLLAGGDRTLWEKYRNDPKQYLQDLQISVYVDE